MKQWLRSSVLLAIPVVAWACSGDPTDVSDGVPSAIVASPQRVFVVQGASEAVSVRLLDERGNPVPTTFTLTAPASGAFTVTEDTTQKLVYDAAGVLVRPSSTTSARYIVAASGFAKDSFKVESADGKSTYVVVSSYPTTVPVTFSTTTPAVGQVITVTAPAGTFFRPTTTATIPGGTVNILTRAADSNSVTIGISAGSNGPITFTNLGIRSDPSLSFSVPTATSIKLAAVTTFPATISSTTPSGGAATTVTAGAGFKFSPSATVSIGGTTAVTSGISADSSVLTIRPIPGSTGAVLVTGGVAGGFALGPLPSTIASVTAGATATKVAGTDALATAPQLTVKTGVASGVVSTPPFGYAGCTAILPQLGDPCDVYKVVTTTAGQKVDVTLNWNNNSDLGLYVLNTAGTGLLAGAGSADAGGTGSSGHPETATLTFATPGTYYLAVLRFTYAGSTADPTYYSLQIVGQ